MKPVETTQIDFELEVYIRRLNNALRQNANIDYVEELCKRVEERFNPTEKTFEDTAHMLTSLLTKEEKENLVKITKQRKLATPVIGNEGLVYMLLLSLYRRGKFSK